ncbi:sigma-70 family RNA polymerase sigma factor [Gemmata sp. G18]|uniref:Sigma-70 family RNA polymerase sigma factor n=1 Tax=Gemmata palustris TaxID=2822762 RepID=A0ABS5BTY8_9BACT|nr:sigma-70 family RNA polymerase sigma factor [Gemmata palustris]MBP3956892.1 sigma-70 family RNA polymerase sigma factor [Gemmata palustris]
MNRTPLTHLAHRLRPRDPALAAATDRQLLHRSRSGSDGGAFAELVRRHERAVLAACRQVLSTPADVEDAFQATFLVLVQQANRIRSDGSASLGGWLFAVAHRVAVRAVRSRVRKDRRETAAARAGAVAPEPAADLSWREAVAALHEALDALPDRFRLPLVLCYLDGLSRDEAAAQLGWTAGSVKAGLERGREKLRAALECRGVTLGAGLLTALAGFGSSATASAELFAATLRVADGSAPAPVLELARPAMTPFTTSAKFLLGTAAIGALCVGLYAAGLNEPTQQPLPITKSVDPKPDAPAPNSKAVVIAPDAIGAGEPATVAGRVVGPAGKPVGGATVVWRQKPANAHGQFHADPAELYPAPVTGRTDAEGKFKLDVVIRGRTPFRPFNPWGNLTVLADGFGPCASHTGDLIGEKWNQNIELTLAKTDVPIEGRVIDLEGKPVAEVTVRPVMVFFNIAGDLGPWLKSVTGTDYPPDRHQVGISIPAADLELTQSATTDKDGLFKLTGLGNERVVGLRVDGPTIETHYIQVMTRPGEKLTITNRLAWDPLIGPNDVYPAKFTHAVAPGGAVRGTVTAADTGKPLAGVRVTSAAWVPGSMIPPLRNVTFTDRDGRYTLTGYPRRTPYMLRFDPPNDQPYVAFYGDVHSSEDGKPRTVDMKLPRGVLVSGTVTDKQSRKPLSAVVDYHPSSANTNLGAKYPVPKQATCDPKDGSFKLVVLPGDGLLAARISDPCRGAYLPGVGAEEVSWFDKTKNSFASAHLGFPRSFYDSYVGIAPKADSDPLKIDLKLDPGVTAAARFVDPDGTPLTGCSLMTTGHGPDVQDIRDLPTDRVTLYALDPKRAATGIVLNKKCKLAGTFTIDGTKPGEVVVKLQPTATVTARLLDSDGAPLARATVVGHVRADEKTRPTGFYGTSDKDGNVRIEVVPPGVPVTGEVRQFTGKKNLRFVVPGFDNVVLKPGEVRDLGDVKISTEGKDQ